MSWLDRFLAEGTGRMVQGVHQVAEPVPVHVFDPTLKPLLSGLPPEEAQALRAERAGIIEYEAGFTRAEAERRAGLR